MNSIIGEALQHAPIGVLVGRTSGPILAANASACGVLGYTSEEVLALEPSDIIPSAPELLGPALEASEEKRGRTLARRKGGTQTGIEYLAASTRLGGAPGFVLLILAVTPP